MNITSNMIDDRLSKIITLLDMQSAAFVFASQEEMNLIFNLQYDLHSFVQKVKHGNTILELMSIYSDIEPAAMNWKHCIDRDKKLNSLVKNYCNGVLMLFVNVDSLLEVKLHELQEGLKDQSNIFDDILADIDDE